MKHAGADALIVLSDVLEAVRSRAVLVERRPGIFYLRGRAFLHFHEDRAGLFADLRGGEDWERFPVNNPKEREQLVKAVDRVLRSE
jgi:hypothetical protein